MASEETTDVEYDLSTISSGVDYLKNGYIEYAQEVIVGRALANLYDGLKPVNRRIIYTLYADKVTKSYMKSARIAGNVLALHPHGDSSVYQAMVLMTNKNGSLAFPLVDGSGNYGGVYKDDPPAASRYTEARLHPNALKEYFEEMNGINMIPNFDSTMNEPELLPVSFPSVLVNATSGIAVGFRSNIPSFNFNDVCDLVIEYIENGECSTVIKPDFVTGGYYINNDKELLKLMKAGVGRIKLRAKYIVDGKKVVVTEVPYGKTIQRLVKQINNSECQAIRNAYDTDDYEHGAGFTVNVTNKNRVDEAIYAMLKETDMQYTYNADITVVKDGAPVRLGVWGIIEEWVKWRRQVLTKEYTHQYEAQKEALREAVAFMNIVNDYDKRMELIRIIGDSGREAGKKYIKENFTREQVPEDLIDFCAGRSLPSYHDGGKFRKIEAEGSLVLKSLEEDIADIDSVIKRQMRSLKSNYGALMPRRTEVTTKDYEFIENKGLKDSVIDNTYCCYSFKNGFLRKLRSKSYDKDAEYVIDGTASSTLIAFDNRGRLLRVYCQDLPLNGTDIGTYLPVYFGLEESDDYKILWIGLLTGKELMLLYKDGNVGFVDTSEWNNSTRNVKVLQEGIAVSVAPQLGAVITDIPDMLYVTDSHSRLAWVETASLKRKHRTAKTRAFNLKKGESLTTYIPCSSTEGMLFINNYGEYNCKLKEISDFSDIHGDLSKEVEMFK